MQPTEFDKVFREQRVVSDFTFESLLINLLLQKDGSTRQLSAS